VGDRVQGSGRFCESLVVEMWKEGEGKKGRKEARCGKIEK
jgi:hypothetical protein